MRRLVAWALLGAALSPAAVANAAGTPGGASPEVASISAGFAPYRLGGPTSVELGFSIAARDGGLPSAVRSIDLHYPLGLGLATSELGLASCDPARLRLAGQEACPRNSIMGSGSALAEFQVSPLISQESASVALVAGPSANGYVKIVIAASGAYPVKARIVMESTLRPGELAIDVPLVRGVPGGPAVAVVGARLTIGGRLLYVERRHGERVFYHPRGIQLPNRCPRGGFHFSASFSFLDGSSTEARTVVRCPPVQHRAALAAGANEPATPHDD
ncbi:MAG: hypothetical protein ACYCUM_05010 [Solirubrobacteraceae bacterium]